MAIRVSVEYLNTQKNIDDGKVIKNAIRNAFKILDNSNQYELALILCDKDYIHSLNQLYRSIDAPTDVLSFKANELDPETGVTYLGDIIISHPVAYAQAIQAGHSTQDELVILSIHGLLHLLGYDHSSPDEKVAMWSVQSKILEKLGIKDPVLTGDE